MIIGQKKILDYINTSLSQFPSFTILVAPQGSGKRILAHYIADRLGAEYAPCGVKVDEVREVIETAMTVQTKVVYCFEDADNMRNEAKNSMLKITEEPPKNAYFIMTVENDGNILDTIKSRAVVLHLEPYTRDEISQYLDSGKFISSDYDKDLVCDIATTPRQAELLFAYGEDFIDYVNLVIDNIAEVEPANAFKSSKMLSFKKEDVDKYDLVLFWSMFNALCLRRITEDPLRYAHGISVTSPFIYKATRMGVNLGQLYDSWVFKIREAWL